MNLEKTLDTPGFRERAKKKAEIALAQGDLSKAFQRYVIANDSEGLYELATAFLKRGRPKEAAKAGKKAKEIESQNKT